MCCFWWFWFYTFPSFLLRENGVRLILSSRSCEQSDVCASLSRNLSNRLLILVENKIWKLLGKSSLDKCSKTIFMTIVDIIMAVRWLQFSRVLASCVLWQKFLLIHSFFILMVQITSNNGEGCCCLGEQGGCQWHHMLCSGGRRYLNPTLDLYFSYFFSKF